MKCEGMPTQRLEEKRVKRREWRSAQGRGREGEREKEHTHVEGRERARARTHMEQRERESTLAPPFICFFLHLGLPYADWA